MLNISAQLRMFVGEGQCPACFQLLDRGHCDCCGDFSLDGDHVSLRGSGCQHWPMYWDKDDIRRPYPDNHHDLFTFKGGNSQ